MQGEKKTKTQNRLWTVPCPSCEVEKEEGKKPSRCGEERGGLSAGCSLSAGIVGGGGRDRLKRVSNHDIPVLTPQLFKGEKNSPLASEMHHHLAASREMLKLQVRGFPLFFFSSSWASHANEVVAAKGCDVALHIPYACFFFMSSPFIYLFLFTTENASLSS